MATENFKVDSEIFRMTIVDSDGYGKSVLVRITESMSDESILQSFQKASPLVIREWMKAYKNGTLPKTLGQEQIYETSRQT